MSIPRSTLHRFVDGALTVRLATISKRGTPLLTPLWFAREGDVVYAGTRRGSIQARHIAENQRVVMLFGDRRGKRTPQVLRVSGTANVRDYESMALVRKGRVLLRYVLRPAALAHWVANWRKLAVRNRYYAERPDRSFIEITLEEAEFLSQPHS